MISAAEVINNGVSIWAKLSNPPMVFKKLAVTLVVVKGNEVWGVLIYTLLKEVKLGTLESLSYKITLEVR